MRLNSRQRLFILASVFVLFLIICNQLYLRSINSSFGQSVPVSDVPSEQVMTVPEVQPTEPEIKLDPVIQDDMPPENSKRRARAAMVVLARNSDLKDIRESMRQLEDRFNYQYNYPWIFLNDAPFSEEFKMMTQVMTRGKCEYGLIPTEHWSYPSSINQTYAKETREEMVRQKVIYGGSESYRHMCRFNSGFFYRHPLLADLDYYWRVEPGVKFYCDLDYDPFLFMQDNNKLYAFTISLYEYEATIPTLWKTTKEFMKKYPEHVKVNSALEFISDDKGETYNRCHFWSNFEIGALSLWRSPAYTAYFDYLDQAGGFFYERWGDAPVHSIGAALFAEPSQLHFFNDIGYFHNPFHHCPTDLAHQKKCLCNPADNFDSNGYSCTEKFRDMMKKRGLKTD